MLDLTTVLILFRPLNDSAQLSRRWQAPYNVWPWVPWCWTRKRELVWGRVNNRCWECLFIVVLFLLTPLLMHSLRRVLGLGRSSRYKSPGLSTNIKFFVIFTLWTLLIECYCYCLCSKGWLGLLSGEDSDIPGNPVVVGKCWHKQTTYKNLWYIAKNPQVRFRPLSENRPLQARERTRIRM